MARSKKVTKGTKVRNATKRGLPTKGKATKKVSKRRDGASGTISETDQS